MLFQFLKYLQPTHYFTLKRKNKASIFPVVDTLPTEVLNQLQIDAGFTSEQATAYDLSWQAVQKGHIGTVETYKETMSLPLEDEYRFIHKYFSNVWGFYVLLVRLFTFKKPIRELKAYQKGKAVSRSLYLETPIRYNGYQDFNSQLVASRPFISIIIPTLNRYRYLKDVLQDLEKQTYTHFEVIVVDQSEPFQSNFYESFNLEIDCVYQKEKALWKARNTAIKKSKGEYILLFDDDSRVESDWVYQHLKCLDYFKAELSSGVSISQVGDKVPAHYSFFRVSDQLDTGNVLIKKTVFKSLGLFDRQFEKQRMGDGEFGLRAFLSGCLNVSNPYAKRLHLKVGSGGLRDMGSWDAFRPKNIFAPRPIPSVLYFFRRYFGNKAAKRSLLRTVPLSIMPYRFKAHKKLIIVGVFVSLLLLPLVAFQVAKSWYLATRKLKLGPQIETLS